MKGSAEGEARGARPLQDILDKIVYNTIHAL